MKILGNLATNDQLWWDTMPPGDGLVVFCGHFAFDSTLLR